MLRRETCRRHGLHNDHTVGRHSIVSLGTAAFLAVAAFAVSVVVTAFATFAGAKYETAPEDHRDDEHNAGERDDNAASRKAAHRADAICPNARPPAAVRRPRLSRSVAPALCQS